MFNRPRFIALILVMTVTLVLVNLPTRVVARCKLAVATVFLPLFGVADSGLQLERHVTATLLPRPELAAELDRLRRENQELKLQAREAREIRRENREFRAAFGWHQRAEWNLRFARVIGRDPANWWRAIHIDVGTRDGMVANLPVLTPDGLVGRIYQAGLNRSQVVLVGDPNCRLAALVQETRDAGIVAPSTSGILDHQIVDLTYLPSNAAINPGQEVVTAGLGGIFPKGIPLGRIVDVRTVGYGLYAEARIRLTVPMSRLEEVWVIMP